MEFVTLILGVVFGYMASRSVWKKEFSNLVIKSKGELTELSDSLTVLKESNTKLNKRVSELEGK